VIRQYETRCPTLTGAGVGRLRHCDRALTFTPISDSETSSEALTFKIKRQRLIAMTEHKFKIGQIVYFHPAKSSLATGGPSGPYQITRRLPGWTESFSIRSKAPTKITSALRRKAS
jgi:hypothetical protein